MSFTKPLRLIACGGTFDKQYDEIAGELAFSESQVPAIVKRARITGPVAVQLLPPLDSLDMQDADRARILEACRAAPEAALVIVHGTDTMRETAAVLAQSVEERSDPVPATDERNSAATLARDGTTSSSPAKTVVLTGAMIPYAIENSDALFNLGFACACAQTLPAGVYIAMNGRVFAWNDVRKNRVAGVFESL